MGIYFTWNQDKGQEIMKAIVWSKTPCPYCENAKKLLDSKGIEYEVRDVTAGTWTKEQLLEAVPNARTVPQVFLDDELIGGYTELVAHLKG